MDSVINGLLAMGIKDEVIGEADNLGSDKETRIIDMANMVNQFTHNKARIYYGERRNWDAKPRILSSIEKTNNLLDYKPQTEISEGLKRHIIDLLKTENILKKRRVFRCLGVIFKRTMYLGVFYSVL